MKKYCEKCGRRESAKLEVSYSNWDEQWLCYKCYEGYPEDDGLETKCFDDWLADIDTDD